MKDNCDVLPLKSRWTIDDEMAKKTGIGLQIRKAQCGICSNRIKNNLIQCIMFNGTDRKPDFVLAAKKECEKFVPCERLTFESLNNKFYSIAGSVFGFVIGDALGLPCRFISKSEIDIDPVKEMRAYGTYNQYFGTWSSNTAIMLYLLDKIVTNGTLDICSESNIERNAQLYMGHKESESYLSYGTGRFERSYLLVYCFPLAFYIRNLNEQDRFNHMKKVAKFLCKNVSEFNSFIFLVIYLCELMSGKKKENTGSLAVFKCGKLGINLPDELRDFFSGKTVALDKSINKESDIFKLLELAVLSFHSTDNFKDTILKAVNFGGDTNTIAAIAGGISGLYYGLDKVNNNWLQCLMRKEDIYKMLHKFVSIIDKEG